MREKVKVELVSCLNSGSFVKTKHMLKKINRRGVTCHCVSGIIAELYISATKGKQSKFLQLTKKEIENTVDSVNGETYYKIDNSTGQLSKKILNWAGMTSDDEEVLIDLNDHRQFERNSYSFKEIARYVERHM